jgi:hypothetical protein
MRRRHFISRAARGIAFSGAALAVILCTVSSLQWWERQRQDQECRIVTMLLRDYLRDELTVPQIAQVEAHLAMCPLCKSRLVEMQERQKISHHSATPAIVASAVFAAIAYRP